MWHSGLRGAIAYALAIEFPSHNRDLIVSTTSAVVLFTVFVLGGSTARVLAAWGIDVGVEVTHEDNVAVIREATMGSRAKSGWLHFANDTLMPWLLRDHARGARDDHTLLTAEDADGGERGTFLGRGRTFLGERSSFLDGPSFSLGGNGIGTFLGDDSAAAGGASSGQLYSIMDDDDDGGGGGGGGADKPNFDGNHGNPARADANQGNRTEFITDSGL
jgi:hypothetical protein